MSNPLPHHTVKRVPERWLEDEIADWPWQKIAPLPPLILADGSAPAQQQTTVRLCYSEDALYVRFDCQDREIWATYNRTNDPIYDEEVVEVFIAAGKETPVNYYEYEISPDGVGFGVTVRNPDSDRRTLQFQPIDLDRSLVSWEVERIDHKQRWWVVLEIPWSEIAPPGRLPSEWRANFYRIERPHDPISKEEMPEFSCWSPTLTDPADYHKPERFGLLRLE